MKEIILLLFLGPCLGIFSQDYESFNFPILISKVNIGDVNFSKDSVTEYRIDSILVSLPSCEKYFKYLVNIEDSHLFEMLNNSEYTSLTIDFEGYKYVRVKNQIYLVLNPYLGVFSYKYEQLDSVDGVNDGVFSFAEIFKFNNLGELIYTPICNRRIENLSPLFNCGCEKNR